MVPKEAISTGTSKKARLHFTVNIMNPFDTKKTGYHSLFYGANFLFKMIQSQTSHQNFMLNLFQ